MHWLPQEVDNKVSKKELHIFRLEAAVREIKRNELRAEKNKVTRAKIKTSHFEIT